MIIIDKSHSKLDLIELFNSLSVFIPRRLIKQEIIGNIPEYISNAKYNDKVKDVSELIDILKSKTKKQRPNLKLKNLIMLKAKKVVKYCSDNYKLSDSTYLSHEDVYHDVMFIASYGDISTVRKACNLYNDSPFCINHINPILSDDKVKEISNKRIIKKNKVFGLKSKKGKVILTFN